MNGYYVYSLKQDFPPRRKGRIVQIRADRLELTADEDFLRIAEIALSEHEAQRAAEFSHLEEFLYDEPAGKILHHSGRDLLAAAAVGPEAFASVDNMTMAGGLGIAGATTKNAGRKLHEYFYGVEASWEYPADDDPDGDIKLEATRGEFVRRFTALADEPEMRRTLWAATHGTLGDLVLALAELPAPARARVRESGLFSNADLNALDRVPEVRR